MSYNQPQPEILSKVWATFMSQENMVWIGKEIFSRKGDSVENLKSWPYPPDPPKESVVVPNPKHYFLGLLFLWMPQKLLHGD